MPRVVECHKCGAESPGWGRFCAACGAPLGGHCGRCEAPLLAGARFCPRCGAPVAPAAPAEEAGHLPEERRTATILFADLTGFTAASESLDPELVKTLVDRGLQRLAAEVTERGGRIDKYIGDNVMGVFGAPSAHEDDPERAVRTGLAMQAAMAEVNSLSAETADFSLRIGINTGEVIAGTMGGSYTVIGNAVNVAARLQEACRPGAVLVGAATWRRTREQLDYVALDPIELRGLSRPLPAYEAIGSRSGDRPPAAKSASPLVGRTAEIELLASVIAGAAAERKPHLVTTLGPPGIGKTRLFSELVSRLRRRSDAPVVLDGHCPAYGLGAAYWPFRGVIGSAFGLELAAPESGSGETTEQLAEAIEGALARAGRQAEHPPELLASRLGTMLGLESPGEGGAARDEEDSALQREQMFAAARAAIEAIACEQPVVIGIDDLQWADEGTLDLIESLTRWVDAPVTVVCMSREELVDRRPDWGAGRRQATTLRLGPLDEQGANELLATLLDDAPAELIPQLASRCGGNPLFAEEMAGQILDRGHESVNELPETIHAVIDARLDGLERGERRLIHHAAVVGDRFWDSALTELAREEGIDLDQALSRLVDLDLIAPAGTSRLRETREFRFRHVLIQEVAYSRLPISQRAHKHAEIGAFLEREGGESMVAMTARHFSAAFRAAQEARLDERFRRGVGESARRALGAAGDAAAAVYANGEAAEHYEAALEISGIAPLERARLLERLGDISLRGGRAAEAGEVWSLCLGLAEEAELTAAHVARLHRKLGAADRQRGDRHAAIEHVRAGIDLLRDEHGASLELAKLYGDAATLYMGTGENLLAIYAAEQSLSLADRLSDPASASRAYATFGRIFGRIGDEARARTNLEAAIERARDSEPADLVRALLGLGAHLEASELDLDQAAGAYEEALEIARRLGSVPDQIELHAGIARIALRRGDHERVRRATEAGETLAERAGLGGLACFSRLTRGWLQWCDGDPDALRSLEEAEQRAQAIGRMDVVFQALMLQGWVRFSAADFGAAERAFSAALAVCERTGLLAQSIEVSAARAINLAREGERNELALRIAEEASATAERQRSALAAAAALEARGATEPDAGKATETLAAAARAWADLGRPLATARAETLRGWRLLDADRRAGVEALRQAAERSATLGVRPLTREAERLAHQASAD